jgi:tRNA (cytidine/uridine-2'-O-)-methyltransferase
MSLHWPALPFHIVLVEPEIPPNTGNISRTCAATGTALHLVEPLGFSIADKDLKRAGLDYWPHVDLHLHPSLAHCLDRADPKRVWYFSKKATRHYHEVNFRPGDWLVFGPETRGLPESLLHDAGEQAISLPMRGEAVRSLNLGSSVAIALYEALRQQFIQNRSGT